MEVGEGAVAVGNHDAGVAANVAEGFVVGAGDDVSAVAAHEAELVAARDWWEGVVVPCGVVAGAGGRVG